MRKELEDAHKGQTMLFDKLISCCKEVRILILRLHRAWNPFLTTFGPWT